MSESLLVALISGFCTLAGSCAGVLASSRLTQYRLAQLEKRVAQHNNLIERTYRLEGRMDEAEHGLQEIRGGWRNTTLLSRPKRRTSGVRYINTTLRNRGKYNECILD